MHAFPAYFKHHFTDVDAHQAGSLEREGKRRRLSCNKALVLLVSSKRTEQQEAASGLRLVTKDIIDGLAEADAAAAEKFTAIAYCTVHNLKDFVLDPPRSGKKLQYATVCDGRASRAHCGTAAAAA